METPQDKTAPPHELEGAHLQRSLSNRHIQLIAIGGAIGTGLFMGSGKTISLAGPSILLVYAVVGVALFFVMRAMGELLLHNLHYKSFQDFAADFIGPWAGYVSGWTYWLCWVVTGMADVIAVTGYWNFWINPGDPGDIKPLSVVLALAVLALLLGLNLLTVKLFGELEFWFALIKIIAILILIFMGTWMVLTSFGYQAPGSGGTSHEVRASMSHLWDHGGFFPTGWAGFFAGFQIAVFAFVGIELVGTTAAETKDPVRTLPRAINSIPARILFFYIFALAAIMVVTPWDEVRPDQSPFVHLFSVAGLGAAASVMNFVVLTSASSSANSGIFSTSRMLYGLAHKGEAPTRFGRLTRHNVPDQGLFLTVGLIGCSVALLLSDSVMAAFTVVTTISALLFVVVWSLILWSYLAYRRREPDAHESSRFPMPAGKAMSWIVLVFFAGIVILLTQQEDTRRALLVTPVWFVVLALGWLKIRGRVHTDDTDER